jgi:flagellar assembly factor FliW
MVLSNGKEFKLPFEIQIDEKDIRELNLGQDSKTHILAVVFIETVNGL